MKEAHMDRTEATEILTKAGRGAEIIEIMERKQDGVRAAYQNIESDPELTEEAKRSRQAAHYLGVMAGVERELVNLASRVQVVDHDDASNIFGVKGLDGDPASLSISRRDAADRVAACTSSGERRELLARATRSGDEVLARAVVEYAVAHADDKTTNQYLRSHPEHEAGIQRLWDAERGASADTKFKVTLALSNLRPRQLGSMPSYEIERLAQAASR